jgi:hypothetical protein
MTSLTLLCLVFLTNCGQTREAAFADGSVLKDRRGCAYVAFDYKGLAVIKFSASESEKTCRFPSGAN